METQTAALHFPTDLAAVMRPGWQATAAIGMASDNVRPVARVVLANYDADRESTADLLGAALAVAHEVDEADEALFDRLFAIIEPIWEHFLTVNQGLSDEIRKAGLIAIVSLIFGVAGYFVANESMEIARAGPTAVQLDKLAAEAAAVMREEAEKSRNAHLDDARRLRHLREPSAARVAPDADAPVIMTIYPDELIRVIDERGDWVKVEVFQYDASDLVVAWIPRKLVVHRGS